MSFRVCSCHLMYVHVISCMLMSFIVCSCHVMFSKLGATIIDITGEIDPNKIPTAQEITPGMSPSLWNATWDELCTRVPKHLITPPRKAFTLMMNHVASHPYLEKYALVRSLNRLEKQRKHQACANVAHVIYYVLWHVKVKFNKHGIKSKGSKDGMYIYVLLMFN